jgi:hypothetical protein
LTNRQHEMQSERDLVQVAAKPFDQYKDVALTSLTAYSLFWLHAWQLPRTIEAIAILNWRLFPQKFAMVGFAEYPDAFRTNRSLLQMQPKYRNLLTGAAAKGFSLNARGMEIAQELTTQLGAPSKSDGGSLGERPLSIIAPAANKRPARSIEPERELSRLRHSKLFEKWRNGVMTDRDLIHVHALLEIFDHTPGSVRVRAMKLLERSAENLGDEEAQRFLSEVRKAFPHVLTN